MAQSNKTAPTNNEKDDFSLLTSSSRLTPETLWKMGRVSDPQLSPDGKTVIYAVRTYDVAANKGQGDIYSIPVAGGNPVAIVKTPDDEGAARWRPDGKKIGFIANDKDGTSQIWEVNPDGSGKMQVTNLKTDVSNFAYSPAGNKIWFTTDVKIDKMPNEIYPDLPKATGRIFDDLMYRHWTEWEDGAYSHVMIANYADGKVTDAKDIMTGERYDTPLKPDGGDEQIAWSKDGKYVAYTCKKLFGKDYAVSTNSDIYLYDIAAAKTTNLSEGNLGYDVNPCFSPDGTKMIWLSMETASYEADRNRIISYDFATKTKTDLTKGFDYSVSNANYSEDGKMIYFLCGINATDQVWSLDLNPKSKMPIRLGWLI